ncbi:tRNA-uridine aminocarboxypropyltransferase [Sandaracinus amylolyticus]|uniref:tRNA-uridine aminocarboxypropyltransferase n=1 Tax=Sandaracinus amylolyticus TaxID=927083 RepID=A0A0F6YN31_9BACT|nr:tRNA-uridine aminocarboxypropyltransferase [Sandaracinus amylolyticus]AKF09941.1 Hypothetical protein DB32_007090 [Sandaracinus amylolyticus]
MTERPMRSRRIPRCTTCGLPDALCFCAELPPPLEVATRVVLVVHRKEVLKPTNTGRLAVRLLEGASLVVRGDRDAERAPLALEGRRRVLFPAPEARVLDASDRGCTLIVPDGSWAQARKVLRRDPLAEGAEPVVLPPSDASRYGLRRNPREGGLCTIEAIARALGVVESPQIEARLLEVLDTFVARHRDVRRPPAPRR